MSEEITETKPQRNQMLDIAKGIGILIVVYCHSVEIYNGGFVFRFFYLFHMAFFFILSGYFFKEKYALNWESIKDFIRKRAKSLLIPYLVFNIIFLFLHNVFLDIYFLPSSEKFFTDVLDTKVMLNQPIDRFTALRTLIHFLCISVLGKEEFFVGTTWFLKVLFYIASFYLLGFYFVSKLKNDKIKDFVNLFICLVCLGIGYFLSIKDWEVYKIGTILSCVILYHIGTMHKKYEAKIPKNINVYFAFIIVTALLWFININNPRHFNISHNYYNNPLWYLSASVLGYIWVLQISKILNKSEFLTKILSYIGKHTISILCLHLLFFKVTIIFQIFLWHKPIQMLQAYPAYLSTYAWGFVYTFISVVCCLLSLKLYEAVKNKIKHYIFLR